ncbi:MAG: tripartite tricarboxylate transporter TctB family protein [Deltaproteobacteria bacterium]|nr:tripartite tricarboxylate transporter TctB family protein [Deltaproteobacteria bacterium]
MKNILQYTFTSLWIVGVAIALYVARNWNSTTALFPKSVGYPMLALLIAILVIDILKGLRRKEKGKGAEEDDFSAKNRCMVVYLSWLVGFALLVWAISIQYAIPIYIFAYMKIQGKYSWLKSALYAAAATAFVFLLFQYAFSVSWPDGEIQTLLGL